MATTGPFLDEAGVSALWSKCKAWFGRKLGVSPASTTVDVQLQNEGGTTLATGTIPAATQSAAGVLTAADKTKLDGVATGATKVTVDSSLSSTSTNPLQNKAINSALAGKAPNAHASASTTYGVGTDSNYGHVRLTDATTSTTSAASGGYAASPKAVSDALAAAKAYADGKADQDTKYGLSISGHTVSLVEDGDTASVTVPDNNTTYTLSGALSSHKVTSTLTPSSGSATTSDFTLAAGTGITITDDATNRKMTIATTAEANQNAFSNVKVGTTTIAADAKQDTLTLAAGSNITLTPDTTNDKVTIAATDTNTTYTLGVTGSGASRKVTLLPSDGTTQSVDVPDTTYNDFTGATESAAGTHGLVPAPDAVLSGIPPAAYSIRANGEWYSSQTTIYQDIASGELILKENHLTIDGQSGIDSDSGYAISTATTSANGVMSAADKTKLNGIATGAEVNQNAFSNVKVGSTTVAADAKTDTLELVAGSNVTLTPDATNDKVTIAATDTNTTYGLSISGHTVSLVEGGSTSSVTVPDNDTKDLGSMTGTLGVGHGGTGVSTLGAGVVYHSASGTGALSIASAANIVSAIGNSAVNRATADASGNNIADTYAKKSEITGVYKYKGSVAAEADLPSSPSTGDVYNIESASTYGAAGANVAWNGTAWDSLGEVFALDPLTNSEIDAICV